MKTQKNLPIVFGVLAILLSNVMCAVVAYNYCRMEYGIKYEGFSAPASIAFFTAFPYVIGILVCTILAIVLQRKYKALVDS